MLNWRNLSLNRIHVTRRNNAIRKIIKTTFATAFLLLLISCSADQSDVEIPVAPSKLEPAELVDSTPQTSSSVNFDYPVSVDSAQLFHGYPCTFDCSGHTAGYEWAEEKGIEDSDDCGGNSQSFIEGCKAYAEATAEASAEEDE